MKSPSRRRLGFTLVEMLVGIVISVILVGLLLVMMSQLNSTVLTAGSKMDAFLSAESGFDIMTQKLSDATLNTYYDYDSATAPTTYMRRSDLHFLVEQNALLTSGAPSVFPSANANSGQSIFFVAPSGYSNNTSYANTPGLLNACGYFIQYGANTPYQPSVITSNVRYRYRLMQAVQSTEYNDVYTDPELTTAEGGTWGTFPAVPWFQALGTTALPIAENVIALIIWPQSLAVVDSSGNAVTVSSDYQYSSRQGYPLPTSPAPTSAQQAQAEQLPQILQLTLVAIDAASATRLDTGTSTPPTVIENALKGGSSGPGLFKNTSQYASDLASLESALTAAHIKYEVLSTSVTLRESKWSNGK